MARDLFETPQPQTRDLFAVDPNILDTPRKQVLADELVNRGRIQLLDPTSQPQTQPMAQPQPTGDPRKDAMNELASEIGPLQAFLIGAGEGMYTVGRGLGLLDPAEEAEKQAMAALKEQRPYTTGAGQIVGEAAPFVPLSIVTGGAAAIPTRMAASGAVGALEGGVIQSGREEDVVGGALTGGGIGAGAEMLFPVIGKLGRKIYQKIRGSAPGGSMLDEFGRPTPDLQSVLDEADLSFDDLTDDALEILQKQGAQLSPSQLLRRQRFAEAGVPLTKGELTTDVKQLTKEQRLFESTEDIAADPFREFRLKQSEAIKKNLDSSFGADVTASETGELIQDALQGRKKLLRTQKNDLYNLAAEKAKESGGIPIFGDSIVDSMLDERTLRRLDRTSKGAISDLNETLAEFGIVEPTESMVKKGIEPEVLTLENFDDLRQALNQIERGDQSGAASVAIGPIRKALDTEVDELATTLGERGLPADIIEPLKQARKTVTQLKTEFDPKGLINRLITKKGQGEDMIVEASKVYDKLAARSTPIEQVSRTINSLKKAEDGEEAISSLQASIVMDLIDAGFGTESRKVSGVKIFNPIAFKNRIKNIGEDKLAKIFENNKVSFRKIRNIDKIASDLVPPSGAVPKGSASVILDLMNTLGIASISAKIPGGAFLIGAMQKVSQPIKTGVAVRGALKAEPDVIKLQSLTDLNYPGIASALGISSALKENE